MDRHLHAVIAKHIRERQGDGDVRFHIRHAAAVQAVALAGHGIGIDGPILVRDRNDVSMAGQNYAGTVYRPERRE